MLLRFQKHYKYTSVAISLTLVSAFNCNDVYPNLVECWCVSQHRTHSLLYLQIAELPYENVKPDKSLTLA